MVLLSLRLGDHAHTTLSQPAFCRLFTVIIKRALYSAGVQLLAPHQNHPPFISCQGRKITGTFFPSAVCSELIKSATLLNHPCIFPACSPPSSTAFTASPFGSQAFSPVTGFQGCQLRVTIPPRECCAIISLRIRSKGTPSRFSLLPSSNLPRSKPITAG